MSAVTSLEYSLPFITRSKPSLDALSLSTSGLTTCCCICPTYIHTIKLGCSYSLLIRSRIHKSTSRLSGRQKNCTRRFRGQTKRNSFIA